MPRSSIKHPPRPKRFFVDADDLEITEPKRKSDERAGPPKVEAARLATEAEVTAAIEDAFAFAREQMGRALGVGFPA